MPLSIPSDSPDTRRCPCGAKLRIVQGSRKPFLRCAEFGLEEGECDILLSIPSCECVDINDETNDINSEAAELPGLAQMGTGCVKH